MICEIRADKCYIPRTYISGFDLHKRLDVGIGLAQSVKQTHVPYGSSYSSWKEESQNDCVSSKVALVKLGKCVQKASDLCQQ